MSILFKINGCELKNVTVRDFGYNISASAPESDIGYVSKFHRLVVEQLNAFHFNNCTGENLVFDGVHSGKNPSHVFGGNSNIDIKASNILMNDKNTTY